MTGRSIGLSEALNDYVLGVSLREPEILTRLREETAGMPLAVMQIAPDQGQFMALLAHLMGARRYLEVGTFTGYSALVMALALPEDGELVCCDIDPEATAVARRYWAEAGVADKIDLRVAPALETLDGLLAADRAGTFDLAFIDADKISNQAYYERCLALVRTGGLVMVDNVLYDGQVVVADKSGEHLEAVRAFNRALLDDPRVELSLLPIADGLTLALKR